MRRKLLLHIYNFFFSFLQLHKILGSAVHLGFYLMFYWSHMHNVHSVQWCTICSLHLTHPVLRSTGQLLYCSARGPDPDLDCGGKTRAPRGNPHRHGKNMQTPHREIEPRTLLLWGCSAKPRRQRGACFQLLLPGFFDTWWPFLCQTKTIHPSIKPSVLTSARSLFLTVQRHVRHSVNTEVHLFGSS